MHTSKLPPNELLFEIPQETINVPKSLPKLGKLVTFAVSYVYSGGITVDGQWYAGYHCPAPTVPSGYKLVDVGFGLELNSRPPRATARLMRAEV